MGRELMGTSSSVSCCCSFLLLILLLLHPSSIFSTIATNGGVNDDQDEQHMKPSLVKSVMSLTDTAFPYTSIYMEKGRVVLKKVHDYFRPKPDIESSVIAEGSEVTAADSSVIAASKVEEGGGGIGDRVKEAASKSLEKSKTTLEESAKLAGDALHEVTDKLKNSFLKHQDQPNQPQPEL